MKRTTIRRAAVTAGLTVAAAAVVVSTATTGSAAPPGSAQDAVAKVRAATARYHDVKVAEAHGYVPVSPCEAGPDGVMGVHYLHPALAGDLEVVPTQPELLLYVPTENGLELAGVEYFVAALPGSTAPTTLGHRFDGPMAGHNPQMPEHYDLHVWLWKHNPAGMTAQWNPALSCDGGAR
jgi:hypothetical protein